MKKSFFRFRKFSYLVRIIIKRAKRKFSWLPRVLEVALIIILVEGLGFKNGLLIGLGLYLLLMMFRLWRGRDMLIPLLKQTEQTIFGKPLDKHLWKEGEWKNTKIKIHWKKSEKN